MKEKEEKKIQSEIRTEMKRESRRDLFSPLSLAFIFWFILVVVLPYVLDWLGQGRSFWASIEFEGIVSLFTIAVALIDLFASWRKK